MIHASCFSTFVFTIVIPATETKEASAKISAIDSPQINTNLSGKIFSQNWNPIFTSGNIEGSNNGISISFLHTFADRMNVQPTPSDKRKAILDSTLELIRNNGFQGTTISLIAEKAGVASGTIYHYFENKEAINSELLNIIRIEMLAAMFNKEDENKEFKTRFFNGWTNLCRYFITHPGSLIFIQQYNSAPEIKNNEKRLPVDRFNEFFQFGMDNGLLKKMEYNLVATVVFGAIMSTAKYHLTGRFGYTDQDLCKIASIIWDGIKN